MGKERKALKLTCYELIQGPESFSVGCAPTLEDDLHAVGV